MIDPAPAPVPLAKNIHGSSPQSNQSGNECRPLGSPGSGVIWKITPKMNV